jgi:PTS system cellobiose-specific IIB component
MSSSLLIAAIEKAGSEAGYSLHVITYHSIGSAYWDFGKDAVDVVLVAPQIRFLRKSIEKLASPHGIPVVVIESMSYGMADGESLLQQVINAINDKQEHHEYD